MTRLRGWAPRGDRLLGKVPHGHWRTLTFLAALRCDRIDAPCVIDGPINGDSFRAYVEQLLLPTLRPGDIGGKIERGGAAPQGAYLDVAASLDGGIGFVIELVGIQHIVKSGPQCGARARETDDDAMGRNLGLWDDLRLDETKRETLRLRETRIETDQPSSGCVNSMSVYCSDEA